jgi:hypothetical protein
MPGFTAATILTIAFAVGANSVVFSAVRALPIRPLPIADADELVWVYGSETGGDELARSAVFDPAIALRSE